MKKIESCPACGSRLLIWRPARIGGRKAVLMRCGCGLMFSQERFDFPPVYGDLSGRRYRFTKTIKDERFCSVFGGEIAEGLRSTPDNGTYDLVACEGLERAADPVLYLANHVLCAKPGGALYVTVPDRHIKFSGWFKQLPAEINFFDQDSLHQLLEKAGLTVVRLRPDTGNLLALCRVS